MAGSARSPLARLCLLIVLLIVPPRVAAAASCTAGTVTGTVTHVRDGDTIEVGDLAIRLGGLAAPERSEPGGGAAGAAMRRMVLGRTVRCELNGERTYDRCAGVCYLNGTDIAGSLVRSGLARDCPRYSGGRYAAAEQAAAADGATIGQTYRLPGYCGQGLASGMSGAPATGMSDRQAIVFGAASLFVLLWLSRTTFGRAGPAFRGRKLPSLWRRGGGVARRPRPRRTIMPKAGWRRRAAPARLHLVAAADDEPPRRRTCKVAGINKANQDGVHRQNIIADCREGEPIVLVREPGGGNAVAVYRRNGEKIGYVPCDWAAEITPDLDRGPPVTVRIAAFERFESTGGNSLIGVRLELMPPPKGKV